MTIIVNKMMCAHCVKKVSEALKMMGAKKIKVSLETKKVTFINEIPFETVKNGLEQLGYEVIEG